MIGLLLAALLQSPASASATEHWEPWLRWACLVREGDREAYVLNGVIAQRNDPDNPVEYLRHERALRVLRDDSGVLAGRQARSPMFVVRPGEFWATFADDRDGKPGMLRMLVLKVPQTAGAGRVELSTGNAGGSRRYGAGDCLARLVEQKAKP